MGGPEAAAYKNARNRLSRRKHPHQSVDLSVSDGRVPDSACRGRWAPLLKLEGQEAEASQAAPSPAGPVYGLSRVHLDLPAIVAAYGFESYNEAAVYGASVIRDRILARRRGDVSSENELEDELGLPADGPA